MATRSVSSYTTDAEVVRMQASHSQLSLTQKLKFFLADMLVRKNSHPVALSLVALAMFLSVFSTTSRADDGVPLKVLRYRNTTTGVHAFTTDSKATQSHSGEFRQETGEHLTSDSPFFYLFKKENGGSIPIFRFQDSSGAMALATNDEERKLLRVSGMRELAEPAYVYRTKVEGSSEIYRVRNPKNGDVVYTTSEQEKAYYLKQDWLQMSSLGFTQSSSSSGTGILLADTVRLESGDRALVARTDASGAKITFSTTNSRIAAIRPGVVLYSEKSAAFPLGLVRRVVSLATLDSGGLEIVTQPAGLTDAFSEVHIYLDNRRVLFPNNAKKSGRDIAKSLSSFSIRNHGSGDQQISKSTDATPEYMGEDVALATPLPDGEYIPYWSSDFSNYFYGDQDSSPSLLVEGTATLSCHSRAYL